MDQTPHLVTSLAVVSPRPVSTIGVQRKDVVIVHLVASWLQALHQDGLLFWAGSLSQ
jgi:hypothetical protein